MPERRWIIKFTTAAGVYNAGETAGFDQEQANFYVDKGLAEHVETIDVDREATVGQTLGAARKAAAAEKRKTAKESKRADAAEARIDELEKQLEVAASGGSDS